MITSNDIAIRTVRRKDLSSLYALSQDFSDGGAFMLVSLHTEAPDAIANAIMNVVGMVIAKSKQDMNDD